MSKISSCSASAVLLACLFDRLSASSSCQRKMYRAKQHHVKLGLMILLHTLSCAFAATQGASFCGELDCGLRDSTSAPGSKCCPQELSHLCACMHVNSGADAGQAALTADMFDDQRSKPPADVSHGHACRKQCYKHSQNCSPCLFLASLCKHIRSALC
jgi:hypothetical protein